MSGHAKRKKDAKKDAAKNFMMKYGMELGEICDCRTVHKKAET
jgi:hypothetical protein